MLYLNTMYRVGVPAQYIVLSLCINSIQCNELLNRLDTMYQVWVVLGEYTMMKRVRKIEKLKIVHTTQDVNLDSIL